MRNVTKNNTKNILSHSQYIYTFKDVKLYINSFVICSISIVFDALFDRNECDRNREHLQKRVCFRVNLSVRMGSRVRMVGRGLVGVMARQQGVQRIHAR